MDPGNIVRLLAPDVFLFVSSLFIRRLCKKLLRPVPQISLHENGIPPSDPEVTTGTLIDCHDIILKSDSGINWIISPVWQDLETSEAESDGDSDSEGSSFDSSDETTVPVQAAPPQFVQKLIVFAAGLRLLLSAIMNTAGKVVVTLLLGLAGT